MNDRAFRLDFFIAIAAVLFSGIAAAAAGYQTWIISQQYGASVWPYLTVSTTTNPNGRVIKLDNDGLGPALIRSAQLYVDGKPISSWNALRPVYFRDPLMKLAVKGSTSSNATASIDASTIVRPGDSQTIFSINLPKGVPVKLLVHHPLAIDLCYCSLNNSCWKVHATPGVMSGNYPHPAASCPVPGASINSFVE